nr:U-box domain-containing protein [Endozoicomonas sp.]
MNGIPIKIPINYGPACRGNRTPGHSQCMKIRICQTCNQYLPSGHQSINDSAVIKRKIQIQTDNLEDSHMVEKFIQSLKEINEDYLNRFESSLNELKKMIEDDSNVLRDKDGVMLFVERSDVTDVVSKNISNVKFLIKEMFRKWVVLSQSSWTHHEEIKRMLDFYGERYNGGASKGTIGMSISKYMKNGADLAQALKQFIDWDESREWDCLERMGKDMIFDLTLYFSNERVSNKKFRLSGMPLQSNFTFDENHKNKNEKLMGYFKKESVDLIWSICSVMNFGDKTFSIQERFLNYFTQAIKDTRSIDFHNDNSFIAFLCRFEISPEKLSNLIKGMRGINEYKVHLEVLKNKGVISNMTSVKKTVFSLKSFMTTEAITSGELKDRSKRSITCLYDYFRTKIPVKDFLSILFCKSVHAQKEIEQYMNDAEEILSKLQSDDLFGIKLNELKEMTDKIKLKQELHDTKVSTMNSELAALAEKKKAQLAEVLMFKLPKEFMEFSLYVMALITDPISFNLIKKAVCTKYGHTFDEETIKKVLLTTSNKCPFTNQKLTKDDLIPNRAVQSLIDKMSDDQLKEIESAINEVASELKSVPAYSG